MFNEEADAKSHPPHLGQLSKGENICTYQDSNQGTLKLDCKKKVTIWIVFSTSTLMTIRLAMVQFSSGSGTF